jgi:hypothetical protein
MPLWFLDYSSVLGALFWKKSHPIAAFFEYAFGGTTNFTNNY